MSTRELVSGAWHDLVCRYGANTALAARTLDDLLRTYSEPHRHYHTIDHIGALLRLLDEHGNVSDGDAVKLAIIFHDAVYDPMRQDNEAASANLAIESLTALSFPEKLVTKIERYVLATQHGASTEAASDPDLQLLLDLDLSVLASTPDRYRVYAQAIRQEYAAVPDELYRAGRRRVLEAFLARDQIYRTERLRVLWEAAARTNLASEIAELG